MVKPPLMISNSLEPRPPCRAHEQDFFAMNDDQTFVSLIISMLVNMLEYHEKDGKWKKKRKQFARVCSSREARGQSTESNLHPLRSSLPSYAAPSCLRLYFFHGGLLWSVLSKGSLFQFLTIARRKDPRICEASDTFHKEETRQGIYRCSKPAEKARCIRAQFGICLLVAHIPRLLVKKDAPQENSGTHRILRERLQLEAIRAMWTPHRSLAIRGAGGLWHVEASKNECGYQLNLRKA
ncbi:hypothetical protein EJ04DRAFT_588530 [Polyplosphaeria fusca]|uniref:Uncharacterized protein n=1 Tax=Polyplosphaeria fusca TaxID=682080 RepID=A0A9P4UY64_9PLEO|nr:hypothetical protein EJ04DRAFT_588530 [Polyplosphaeria fusca]